MSDFERQMATSRLAGALMGVLGNVSHRLCFHAEFAPGTDDESMEYIARTVREMYGEFDALFPPPDRMGRTRIAWDRKTGEFYDAEECALCPSDAERGRPLCRSCWIAEHGDALDEAHALMGEAL